MVCPGSPSRPRCRGRDVQREPRASGAVEPHMTCRHALLLALVGCWRAPTLEDPCRDAPPDRRMVAGIERLAHGVFLSTDPRAAALPTTLLVAPDRCLRAEDLPFREIAAFGDARLRRWLIESPDRAPVYLAGCVERTPTALRITG